MVLCICEGKQSVKEQQHWQETLVMETPISSTDGLVALIYCGCFQTEIKVRSMTTNASLTYWPNFWERLGAEFFVLRPRPRLSKGPNFHWYQYALGIQILLKSWALPTTSIYGVDWSNKNRPLSTFKMQKWLQVKIELLWQILLGKLKPTSLHSAAYIKCVLSVP